MFLLNHMNMKNIQDPNRPNKHLPDEPNPCLPITMVSQLCYRLPRYVCYEGSLKDLVGWAWRLPFPLKSKKKAQLDKDKGLRPKQELQNLSCVGISKCIPYY